jgi:hypothetical protein
MPLGDIGVEQAGNPDFPCARPAERESLPK